MSASRRPGRPTTNVRVPTLDPHGTALAFTRECLRHSQQHAKQLDPVVVAHDAHDDELAETALFKRVKRLVEYAIRGGDLRGGVDALLKPLEAFAAGPLWDRVDIARIAESVDTQRGDDGVMAMVIAAALAREKLGRDEPLTAGELAVLCGMTRVGIRGAVQRDTLKALTEGSPGHQAGTFTFSPGEARRWLQEHAVRGFGEPRSARKARGK